MVWKQNKSRHSLPASTCGWKEWNARTPRQLLWRNCEAWYLDRVLQELSSPVLLYEMIHQLDAIEYLFVFFQLDMFRAYTPIFRSNGCYNFFTYAAYGVLGVVRCQSWGVCVLVACCTASSLVQFIVLLIASTCGHCCFFALDAGLLVRTQYSERPATGHLDTGLSWFPCVYKQMLIPSCHYMLLT